MYFFVGQGRRCALSALVLAVAVLSLASSALAENVAIVQGGFYTSNLKNQLVAKGHNVTEVTTYTAASLAGFDAVVVYGNAFTDMTALTTYVNGGGTLVETPWFWNNNAPPAALQVVSNGGGVVFSQSYPGITVLDGADPLLNGVSIPGGTGGFNIGRTTGNSFIGGVDAVAQWADGTAMIGHKALGAGNVIAINMHVITSDTAYTVIDQPWAAQLFSNAVSFGGDNAVPLPGVASLGAGLLVALGAGRGSRHRRVA